MVKKFTPSLYLLIKFIVFVAIGFVILFLREQIIENYLRFLVGGLMLLYGIDEIVFEAIFAKKQILHRSKTYLGFVEILLGITLLSVNVLFEAVCVVWAAWSIIRESYEVKEIIVELKYLAPKIISGLESLAVIVLSVMLIIEPGEHHAMIHLYLLLLELPLNPFIPLLDEQIYFYKTIKEKNKE